MAARVFVTGGSGFVGAAVIEELIARGYSVSALSHRRAVAEHGGRVHTVIADLFDTAALEQAMRGCAAVIHLVGIIMERPAQGITFERIHVEGTQSVVDAARRAGERRYIHMSALGTRPAALSNYHKTK